MCAYNRINSQYGCENEHLLTDVLKGDWKFPGYVLTDYGAAKNAVDSLNNGLDLDIWPGLVLNPVAVRAAVESGQVTEATIDEHVHRILRTMFAFGLFDRAAYVDDASRIDQAAHHEAAADVEAQGIVLLENRDRLLPLRERSLQTLAVIGPEADTVKDGGGSSAINEFRITTPLAALRERLGSDRVALRRRLRPGSSSGARGRRGRAVVVVGDRMTEGTDKLAPTLNSGQTDGVDRDALFEVADAQPRTVAVLQSGGPVLTPSATTCPPCCETVVPGTKWRHRAGPCPLRRHRPRRPAARDLPGRRRGRPDRRDPEAYPGVAETAAYKEGVLVGYRHYDAKRPGRAFPSATAWATPGSRTVALGQPARRRHSWRPRPSASPTPAPGAGSAVPQLYVTSRQPAPGSSSRRRRSRRSRRFAGARGQPRRRPRARPAGACPTGTWARRLAGRRRLLRPQARDVVARHRPASEGRLARRLRHAPALTAPSGPDDDQAASCPSTPHQGPLGPHGRRGAGRRWGEGGPTVPRTRGSPMRRMLTTLAGLALAGAVVLSGGLTGAASAASGSAFSEHVRACQQEMGFSGTHNPGVMHHGFSGWDPSHTC